MPGKGLTEKQREVLRLISKDPREFICRLRILDTDGRPTRFSDPYIEQAKALQDLMSPAKLVVHLKPRQIGRTTLECAHNFSHLYWADDAVRTLIVAHHSDSTAAIFGKVRYFHETLPGPLRRPLERSNRQELIFDDTKAGFRCMTAGGKSEGRAWTYQRLHADELAYWPNAEANWASVTSTLHEGPHHRVSIMSTPNGPGGLFYDKVKVARTARRQGDPNVRYEFFKWSDHASYRMPVPEGWEPDEEEWQLAQAESLDMQQLYWRHQKIHGVEGIGISRFRREYPLTEEEGFLQFEGGWFDTDYLNQVLRSLHNIEGELRIFERPEAGMTYAIGVDPSWCNKGDWAVAQVLSADGRQVATLSCNTGGEILFANKVADLAAHYNDARTLVEGNTGGAGPVVIRELLKHGIKLWYQPPQPGSRSIKNPKPWQTHKGNKQDAYSHARQMINGDGLELKDKSTVQELMHIREEGGKIEGQDGETDDHAMALVLAEWNRRTLPQSRARPSLHRRRYKAAKTHPFSFNRPVR